MSLVTYQEPLCALTQLASVMNIFVMESKSAQMEQMNRSAVSFACIRTPILELSFAERNVNIHNVHVTSFFSNAGKVDV